MRIAIVNDMKTISEALRRVISAVPGVEVAWVASEGEQALRRCRMDTPDLLLMDMVMPGMDGVEATRRIMQECPCPILVVTATVDGHSDRVFAALGHGALDVIGTPTLSADGSPINAETLLRKIRSVSVISHRTQAFRPSTVQAPTPTPGPSYVIPRLIAIGGSTGGPQALVHVLRAMPHPIPCPVVIVQHVDEFYAQGMATWLSSETGHLVVGASDGEPVRAGLVYIACTSDHLLVDCGGRLRYSSDPSELPYRPSVDVLFQSLVASGAPSGVAILLTGMGRDGAIGLLSLREKGWHTIAQNAATSVVWGMPGEAVRVGAAREVLDVNDIGAAALGAINRLSRNVPTPEPVR